MVSLSGFFLENKHKLLTVRIWIYTAYFRFMIRFVPMKYWEHTFGVKGEEAEGDLQMEDYRYIKTVSMYVNRSAGHTPWESKCLVRALVAQKLLKKKKIPSTLYLGVGKENESMIAHAWIRSGKAFVTGGNGEGYAIVAKYRA